MDTNLEVGDDGAEIGSQSLSFFGYPESVAEQPAKIRNLASDGQPLLLYGISAYLNSQPAMMVYRNRKFFISGGHPNLASSTLSTTPMAPEILWTMVSPR